MNKQNATLVLIPLEELQIIKDAQQEILQLLKTKQDSSPSALIIKHITAKEFMNAVRIKRTKFDQLVQANKIKIIRKKRKIYVPVSEIDRYFSDSRI